MAMFKCPECGREISDQADMCLGCGISQVKIQKILANKAETAASKEKKNMGTEPIKRVITTVETIEEKYSPRVKLKSVRCVVCNNSFQKTEGACPKCKYPLLSVCGSKDKTEQLVKEYRKEAGIDVVAPVRKSVAVKENTAAKKNTAVKNVTELSSQPVKKMLNLQVGQYHKMGCYQGEEINWRVLAVEGGKALLISEKGLDAKPYNEKSEDITWEQCTLRKWLNGDFLNATFTTEEKTRILETQVTADKNPSYDTDPGRNTVDKVFLLSIQEAKKYFKDDDDRKAYPTESAKNNGAYVDDSTKCCWWWLRSPGNISASAARVDGVGWVFPGGTGVFYDGVCVRPALWVNL